MADGHDLARLFIKCQQHRDRAWRAHIARRDREALEQATMLQLAATELMRALAGKGDLTRKAD